MRQSYLTHKLGKKGASEAFNVIVPILLFVLVCVVFFVLFWFISNYYTAVKALPGYSAEYDPVEYEVKSAISVNNIHAGTDFDSIIFSTFKYKSNIPNSNYRISLYEIIYYNLESQYTGQILSFLEEFYDAGCDAIIPLFPSCSIRRMSGYPTPKLSLVIQSQNDKGHIYNTVKASLDQNFTWRDTLLISGIKIGNRDVALVESWPASSPQELSPAMQRAIFVPN